MPKRRSSTESSLPVKQAFRKFKLVPVDHDDDYDHSKSMFGDSVKSANIETLERRIRKYDPRIQAMANSYGGMHDALFNRNVHHTPSQRLHIYNANRSRIHRMRKGAEGPLEAIGPQEGRVQKSTKEGTELERDQIYKEGLEKGEEVDLKVLKPHPEDIAAAVVPKNYQSKLRNLINLMSNKIRANDRGEVVINGEELPDTSYSDVMRALYVNQKGFVSGLSEVVDELKRAGISSSLLSSARAKSLYNKARVGKVQSGSGFKPHRVLRLY